MDKVKDLSVSTEEEIDCINCNYLIGLYCSLEREEDFNDGKDCPKYIPWWKV